MTVPPRRLVLGWLALLACLFCAPAPALDHAEPPPQFLGKVAGHGALKTADYAGRILVVTFWASWCGPCLSEMNVLERLQREAGERLAVVSINIEADARFRQVRRALEKRLSLTLAHDPYGVARKEWGVGPIPHMFMIDHEGRLAYEHRGYDDAFIPTLVDQINLLLLRQQAASNR
jgi:thiol-disulfide isomerase/thioredoxin